MNTRVILSGDLALLSSIITVTDVRISLNKCIVQYDIAEETSRRADTDGITGFMYGCAVGLLSQFWEYGEDLKKWHNNQYGYEGEGTVNPAIITIG